MTDPRRTPTSTGPAPASLALALVLALSAASAVALVPVPRIIGGNDAADGEYPFMAALLDASEPDDYQAQMCGGTIIASRWVLTAAHCVNGLFPYQLRVLAGHTTLQQLPGQGSRTSIAAIRVHPAFDENSLANDVALLYLDTPVAVATNFSLADAASPVLADNAAVVATGWGMTAQRGANGATADAFTPVLQEVTLSFLTRSTCNDASHYRGELESNVVCAGYTSAPPRDTCLGDSGGPLLAADGGGAWRQVGITSFGESLSCATAGAPGVYTDVAAFAGFIHDVPLYPGLRVKITDTSNTGTRAIARITVTNDSPLNTATGVTMDVGLSGDLTAENLGDLVACTTPTATDAHCTLNDIPPGGYQQFDVRLRIGVTGTLAVAASSPAGDDYTDDNRAHARYGYTPPPQKVEVSGGAATPAVLSLLALLVQRRHNRRHGPRRRNS